MRSLRLQLADSLQQQAAGAFAQWQAGFIIAGNSFVRRQIGYAVKRRFGPAAAAVCLGGTTNYMQSPRAAAHSVVRRPPQLPQKAASQPHQTSALQASGNEAQGCPLIDRILVDMHTHATWKGTTLMDAHGRRRAHHTGTLPRRLVRRGIPYVRRSSYPSASARYEETLENRIHRSSPEAAGAARSPQNCESSSFIIIYTVGWKSPFCVLKLGTRFWRSDDGSLENSYLDSDLFQLAIPESDLFDYPI